MTITREILILILFVLFTPAAFVLMPFISALAIIGGLGVLVYAIISYWIRK